MANTHFVFPGVRLNSRPQYVLGTRNGAINFYSIII